MFLVNKSALSDKSILYADTSVMPAIYIIIFFLCGSLFGTNDSVIANKTVLPTIKKYDLHILCKYCVLPMAKAQLSTIILLTYPNTITT